MHLMLEHQMHVRQLPRHDLAAPPVARLDLEALTRPTRAILGALRRTTRG
jgi:hypothetical protein